MWLKLADFFSEWRVVLTVLTGLCITFFGPLVDKNDFFSSNIWNWIYLGVCITHVALLGISVHKRKETERWRKKAEQFEEEKEGMRSELAALRSNAQGMMDGYLYHLSRNFGFGTHEENNERVSLYVYNADREVFVPFGRYSSNPNYTKYGRGKYPVEGCLGKGWEHTWHFDNGFSKDGQYNPEHHGSHYDISKDTYGSFRMPSQLYAVQRIGQNGDHIGAIVIESTRRDRWSEGELKKKMSNLDRSMPDIIVHLKDHIPGMRNTRSEGF